MIFKEIQKFSNNNEILIQIAHFKPFYGKFSGQTCKGFIFTFPKSNTFMPYTTGVHTILAIRKIHPEFFDKDNIPKEKIEMFLKVTGGSLLLDAIFEGRSDNEIKK